MPRLLSIFTIFFVVVLMVLCMQGLEAVPHVALFLAICLVCSEACFYRRISWGVMEAGLVDGLQAGSKAIFILALVGMLIGAWVISGTIPTLFAYGLTWFSPSYFFLSALGVSIAGSTLTGSSLTTIGTIGVALMGISHAFGLPAEVTAGAVVCGAAFGDKMSPLSDTTNFAPAIAGTELFPHIRYLFGTTIPAMIITMLLFWFLNRNVTLAAASDLESLQAALAASFTLSVVTLIPAILLFIMAVRRWPTIPTLVLGIFSGLLVAGLVQGNWDFTQWAAVLYNGVQRDFSSETLNSMLQRGGLASMLFSISLVILALVLGGAFKAAGIIEDFHQMIVGHAWSKGPLVALTVVASTLVNLVTGEQYLSILFPGQLFREVYIKYKVNLLALGRALEDGGTLVNPLIPWGVSGTFIVAHLGVPVTAYVPYAFFLFLCPLFSVLLGFFQREDAPCDKVI